MFVSFNSNTTGITSGAGTANPSGAQEFFIVFSGVRVAQCSLFCVAVCRSMFLPFVLFFWQYALCCLSFDLRLLVTSLVSDFRLIFT